MIERLLAKMRLRDSVSEAEAKALRKSIVETRRVPADKVVVRANEQITHSTLLIEGFMCRYKDSRSGGRQIAEIHVAGDFADLHSFTLKVIDHNVMSITPCLIGIAPHDRLEQLTQDFPHLTRLLWFLTNLDAAIHREWVFSLGQRSALGRLAHLFCELKIRLEIVGLTQGMSYDLPLTQDEIAECAGITTVHVNRTLQELRRSGAIDFANKRVTIHDWGELSRIAEFDPGYLQLRAQAR